MCHTLVAAGTIACVLAGGVAVAAGQDTLSVGNSSSRISLANRNGTVWASSIRERDREFVVQPTEPTPLWRIELRPATGQETEAVRLDSTAAGGPVTTEEAADGRQVTLTWRGIDVGDEKAALDVVVTITAMPDSPLYDWRIAVTNRAALRGLWRVHFPYITGLTVGSTGHAATPFGTGMIQGDPVHNAHFGFNGTYPHALCSMQFVSLSEARSTLYMATHDPLGYAKGIQLAKAEDGRGLLYTIEQMPEHMGVPGVDYEQPYPCVIGILPGDWYDAARFYRKWVLEESAWMKGKAPLAQRSDLPDWFKRLPFWVGFHGMTDGAMTSLLELKQYVNVPIGVHLYHWQRYDFDTQYPDFLPARPQVPDYIKRLQAVGYKVMPYINCHLMDVYSESWKTDGGAEYAVLGPGKSRQETEWSAGRKDVELVAMCPGTAYWQTKFDRLTQRMVKDMDVDGIYCDQVACVGPELCFNAEHGHPVGGGHWWVSGHARQITNMRKAAKDSGKWVFLTTESAAEPYDFDAFLRCNEGAPFLSPIWQVVYSGYRLSFGFYFYEKREWVVKLAVQYLWGFQPGWAGQHGPGTDATAFEREVARARYAASDYLALGEMLRDPKLTGNIARVKTVWRNFATEHPIDWPAVKGSTWRAPDGSIGVALVNMHTEAQTVTFEIDRQATGLPDGTIEISAAYPPALFEPETLTGERLMYQLTLPARSACMVALRSAGSRPKGP